MSNAAGLRFELLFEAEGHNRDGFRTDITVHRRGRTVESFELPCDEGRIVGGGGTAPWPLCYFASGLAGCFATHLRSFARQLNINLGEFSIAARCRWEARQAGDVPYVARPIEFVLDVDLLGEISDADKRRLVEAAGKGCFAEQSLKPGLVSHRLKSGDAWIEV
jgi:uncharacterized OsmC-like protein